MKAVILAAGKGSRISSSIGPIPKSVLGINGKPIIRRTVEMLLNHGIDVAVCTGYRHTKIEEALKNLDVFYYNNPFFDTTNNIASLWFAKDFLAGDDCLILSADVVFGEDLLVRIINAGCGLFMVTDSSRIMDGDYFFHKDNMGQIIKYGPDIPVCERDCEYTGLDFVSKKYIDSFRNTLLQMIDEGQTQCYYEYIFFKYINNPDIPLKTLDISGCMWREIDNIKDYEKAASEFKC